MLDRGVRSVTDFNEGDDRAHKIMNAGSKFHGIIAKHYSSILIKKKYYEHTIIRNKNVIFKIPLVTISSIYLCFRREILQAR